MKKMNRQGLTLIELIVVVAILAVLAMIVIPKLDTVQSSANHAASSASVADTGRYIQTYRAMKQRFPDGWDTLTDGTALVAGANPANTTAGGTPPYGKGLHTQLGTGSNPKLALNTLTADEVTALSGVGIATFYNWTAPTSASQRPGDRFTTVSTSATPTVAIVNSATSNGRNIIDRVYRQNLKPGGVSGQVNGTNTKKLMALGFGPLNNLVGTMMLEAPQYANVDTLLIYSRNLVLFEIDGTSRPLFKGVVAADGDLLDDLTTYMNRDL
jgi:prepilin-type N-terminal cleavage/methylation domain-containing protein